jgi:hypothetical protein
MTGASARAGAYSVVAMSGGSNARTTAVWRRYRMATVFCIALLVVLTFAVDLHAEEQLHDPALPTVSSEALHQLLDTRTRQKIMAERQSHFPGRCVCQYQTTDSNGRSCKGRHEIVKGKLQPLCYPRQVSQEMVDEWRHFHR